MRALISTLAMLGTLLILCSLWPQSSQGRVMILTPEKMLTEAGVIFTGDIVKFIKPSPDDDPRLTRLVKVKVDRILKGTLDTDTVILKEYQISAATTQKFPQEKAKLLVLQRIQENYPMNYVADSHNIGIIENGAVVEVWEAPPSPPYRDYVGIYNDFYQSNIANAIAPPLPAWKRWIVPLLVASCALIAVAILVIVRRRRTS